MAGYAYTTTGYSYTGNGTNLTPERWFPRLLEQLNKPEAMFIPFLTTAIEGEQFFQLNAGDTVRVNARSQLLPATTALTFGTPIAIANQTTNQVTITISEYGTGLDGASLQKFLTSYPLQETMAADLVDHAVRTVSSVIGETLVAGDEYFVLTGTSSVSANTGAGGGSWYLKPPHLRYMTAYLARLGVSPADDGYYHMFGPAGYAHSILAQSSYADNAARLGDPTGFNLGVVGEYMGIKFHDERGLGGVFTHTASAEGTCIIIGKDAVLGGFDINRPDLLTFYPDPQLDAGRQFKMLSHWLGGCTLAQTGTAEARCYRVLCAMGE
jgi:hypothetical protein